MMGEVLAQLPDYHVQLFDESFGIHTSDVRLSTMDSKGFVWIMHHDRIQKFDGREVVDFRIGGSLYSLLCDREDHIWTASPSTLYRMDNARDGFSTIPVDTTKNLYINSILQLEDESVWVYTNHGFYVFDPLQKSFSPHPHPVLSQSTLGNRAVDEVDHTLFFCKPDSLIAFNLLNSTWKAIALPQYNVRTVTALTSDLVFVSIWKGIVYQYDFASNQIRELDLSRQLPLAQDYFATFFEACQVSPHTYLLATSKGLMQYDLDRDRFRQLRLFQKGKPLEGNLFFLDMFVDRDRNAWIAYTNYGLLSFNIDVHDIGLIRNYEPDIQNAWDNHVRNFAEDDSGHIWLATYNGFAQLDLHTGHIRPFFAKEGATDMINHPSIRGIVYDGTNLILGQTNRGVWLYHPNTKKYRRPDFPPGPTGEEIKRKLEGSFTEQIYTLHNGNHVIAGSNGGYLLNGKTYLVTKIRLPQGSTNVDFTYQDTKKNIWIGTPKALHAFDTTFQFKFKIPRRQTQGTINGLCEWRDGTLIAGGHGLYRITPGDTAATVEKLDPFFDTIEILILYRAGEKIWLATSEGLFRYDVNAKKIESFSNFEHIEGNSFYPNSYCRAQNGLLFLGSSRGIIYFDPDQVGEVKDSLRVYVSKVIINEDDSSFVASPAAMQLKYFQNTIGFEFAAPYYRNANKLRYRYRLEGLKADWVNNGKNNTIRFHDLKPGDYQFVAASSVNGIEWFESGERIAFSISPPFWKTWWFYMFGVCLVAAILYAIYRYQLHKRMEVERLRMGIARDLHDDIGSTISTIHILSSMASTKADASDASRTLFSKIRASSGSILENMQDIVWAINPENDSLEQVFSRMKEFAGELCDGAGMEYDFQMDQHLEPIKLNVRTRKDLFLIFKEAMNNAVKYSEGKMIRLTLNKKPNGRLVLEISDDGRGFQQGNGHVGNGLKNMESRARAMNGELHIHSTPGKGTHVRVDIPIT
jgi:signal transduction histidine kinase/ligand-binding sensor domain-containing protein